MTAIGLRPVLLPGGRLSDEARGKNLRWLARSAQDMAALEVAQLLAVWAHLSLDRAGRERWFALLADSLVRAEALGGPGDWGSEMPELTCDGRTDEARYVLEDRANEALYALVNGEGEK